MSKFIDQTGDKIINNVMSVKSNLYVPSVLGIGYRGEGEFKTSVNGKHTKIYQSWKGMLSRCYSTSNLKRNPCYLDKQVCKEWHNFQVFSQWMSENYNPETMKGWHLDKDILVKGNKIYSPETCCFVPPDINYIFVRNSGDREYPIGVTYKENAFRATLNKKYKSHHIGRFKTPEEAFQAYKIAKEEYIKEIAEEWKNKIPNFLYLLLVNYKVEITD